MHIDTAAQSDLEQALRDCEQRHTDFLEQNLSLDITRGKPAAAQLDLSNSLLDAIPASSVVSGVDLRNYGVLDGLPAAKTLFGSFLGIAEQDAQRSVFVGGNSSLTLMHYSIWFSYHLGLINPAQSWRAEAEQTGKPTKILCPAPGYDRHFSICAELGIEMITVDLTGYGPDMDQVERLVAADDSIKGIWCVPRFSNPTGDVYDADTVARLAELPNKAGNNFTVLWDNAYALHALHDDAADIENIAALARAAGTESHIIQFGSTSKITFASAGIGFMASSEQTIARFTHHFSMASIGSDKLNQLRHIEFLKDLPTTLAHMQKHAAIIRPKFEAVKQALAKLNGTGMGDWNDPDGGYFISFNTRDGLASVIVDLAAEAGLKLTPAGATFPLGKDPKNRNIRIAPTLPALAEVSSAMEVFVNCVKLASLRDKLGR